VKIINDFMRDYAILLAEATGLLMKKGI